MRCLRFFFEWNLLQVRRKAKGIEWASPLHRFVERVEVEIGWKKEELERWDGVGYAGVESAEKAGRKSGWAGEEQRLQGWNEANIQMRFLCRSGERDTKEEEMDEDCHDAGVHKLCLNISRQCPDPEQILGQQVDCLFLSWGLGHDGALVKVREEEHWSIIHRGHSATMTPLLATLLVVKRWKGIWVGRKTEDASGELPAKGFKEHCHHHPEGFGRERIAEMDLRSRASEVEVDRHGRGLSGEPNMKIVSKKEEDDNFFFWLTMRTAIAMST